MIPPLPDVDDPRFAPFWNGTRDRVLRVQRCASCDTARWPPRPICGVCRAFETEWSAVEPRGRLYSWTLVGHQTVPEIPIPYAVGLVELDAPTGVRFLGRIVETDAAALSVGEPMEAVFEPVTEAVVLVYWRSIGRAARASGTASVQSPS